MPAGACSRGLALAAICLTPAAALSQQPSIAAGATGSAGAAGAADIGKRHHGGSSHLQAARAEDPPFAGWLAVAVAMLCFGSFGVPIKSAAVQDAKVHPLVFQSYKTFWVLVTAWFVLCFEDFHFSPWGLLSGVFWIITAMAPRRGVARSRTPTRGKGKEDGEGHSDYSDAQLAAEEAAAEAAVFVGIAAIVAVNSVGLAVGQATWQVTIVVVSFLWGCWGFHEEIKSKLQAVIGVLLLVGGLLGMTLVASRGGARQKMEELTEGVALLSPQGPKAERSAGKPAAGAEASSWLCLTPAQRLGLGAAVFNGAWGGSNLVPMKFAHLGGPRYVISFAVGSAVVNAAIWVLYILHLYIKSPGESVYARLPPLHLGVMKTAGTISGILWSLGNFASMVAVKDLGQAVGYSCVQASIFVSGLWGILLYGEIRGQNITFWLISAVVALAGVILLAEQKG